MMGKKKTAKMKGGGRVKKTAKMRGGGKVKKMNMGGRTGDMMYSRGYGVDERSKRMPTMLMDRGPSGMKKGGRVGKKEQGYKDRKDESIAMRIRKKRTPKQLKASRDESYGKFGSGKGKGVINKRGGGIAKRGFGKSGK
jgi:hypothetical protein